MSNTEVKTLEELRARLVPDQPVLPADVRRGFEEEERERLASQNRRNNDVLIGHGITGFLTFFALQLLFGFPSTLHPWSLVTNLLTSGILGFPIGYVIGVFGGGVLRGALISSVMFTAASWLNNLPLMPSTVWLIGHAIAGLLPGIIIGWSIDAES